MTDTVSIPADKAKTIAQYHRDRSKASPHVVSTEAAEWHRQTADLLDPQPPTLREQVAKEVGDIVRLAVPLVSHDAPEWDAEQADAVLAVVADWLAAQPLNGSCDGIQLTCGRQRDHDVRLLRGAS